MGGGRVGAGVGAGVGLGLGVGVGERTGERGERGWGFEDAAHKYGARRAMRAG